jgi:hypothetical protein
LLDEQTNGDGVVSIRFENTHVNGRAGAYLVIDRAGFGPFWNYGGWSNSNGVINFSNGIDFQFQPLREGTEHSIKRGEKAKKEFDAASYNRYYVNYKIGERREAGSILRRFLRFVLWGRVPESGFLFPPSEPLF